MISSGMHRSLYSINDPEYGGLRYEKCYPIGTRIVPDGHGGLWIHEGTRLGDTINWPLLHRSKHGREIKRFEVPRNCDLEPDGNGGVWAISRPEQEPDNNHISEVTRYLVANEEDGGVIEQHAAYAPEGTDTYYAGGRGGKVWVAVQADDDYDFNEEQKNQMLDDGLWIVGHSSCERVDDISGDIGFSTGDVDPDGCGGLWLLEESSELDDLVLKHYNHRGELRVTPFHFPIGGTEVYACDRTDSVFVYYQTPDAEDDEHDGVLKYIFRENGDWRSKLIGEQLPSLDKTKFISTGDGELWGMMKDTDNHVKFWKCTSTEMRPLPYEWPLRFSETEMIEG